MISIMKVYGGIFNLLKNSLSSDQSTTFISGLDMDELVAALKPETRVFWMEVAFLLSNTIEYSLAHNDLYPHTE